MKYSVVRIFIVAILCPFSGCSNDRDEQEPNPEDQDGNVVVYRAPEQEPESADFKMSVNDRPVFIYQARVSKYPINQVWPGYQRSKDQTEIASFAYFDTEESTWELRRVAYDIKSVQARIKKSGLPWRHALRLAEGW